MTLYMSCIEVINLSYTLQDIFQSIVINLVILNSSFSVVCVIVVVVVLFVLVKQPGDRDDEGDVLHSV